MIRLNEREQCRKICGREESQLIGHTLTLRDILEGELRKIRARGRPKLENFSQIIKDMG